MKTISVLTLLFVFVLAAATAYAHPPSNIVITYDPLSKVLTAVIYHNVSNPARHYIKKADIGLNGKEIMTLNFTKQDNNTTQSLVQDLSDRTIKPGDKLSVEGYCSISGSLEKEITVASAAGAKK